LRHALLALQATAVLLAAGVLLVPLPAPAVERYYADWFYPALQSHLTSWSNASGVSLFDLLVVTAGGAVLLAWVRTGRHAVHQRSLRPVGRAAGVTVVAGSLVYLWFVGVWGLNYARDPLERTIGYDATRVNAPAVGRLAERAAAEVNLAYAAAHHVGFPSVGDMPLALVRAIHDVERRLGRPRPTTPGRPKRTLLATFFRTAGVDGMLAPFLLETLVNPDLTPPERPAVLAHEWAHLSGYGPEAEASFVGLLAALSADAPSRYSAWLVLFDEAAGQIPSEDRRRVITRLEPGPQADRRAIANRLQARVEVVARTSWTAYDQYLKAQGVREGVRSYSRVVQLMLGSGALDWP
jgi:hypothetical protein